MTRQQALFWWVVGSAGLMLIGAFGPWVKALGVSANGTDGNNDGWLVVGAAVIGGGVFLLKRYSRFAGIWPFLGGVAGTITTVYDRSNIKDAVEEGGEFVRALVQVGWGLNLAMVASISFAASGVAWFLKHEELVAAAPSPTEPA
jgi:hypothetical protein